MHNIHRREIDNLQVELSNFNKMAGKVNAASATPDSVFMSAKEKNTSEEEVELSKFYEEKPEVRDEQTDPNQRLTKLEKLDSILDAVNLFEEDPAEKKKFPENIGSGIREIATKLNQPVPDLQIEEKDRFKDNTTVMIETWKSLTKDPELLKLLDDVGELPLHQAQLFWKVWESQ